MPRVFFDTNVMLYAVDGTAPAKRRTSRRLIEDGLTSGNGAISYQVAQEWLNVALGKARLPQQEAEAFLHGLLIPLWKVQPGAELFELALSVRQETGWGWYDSLIVAAASQHGCTALYTEDLQAGRRVRGVEIVNPYS